MSPFEESNVGALMALMGRPGGDVAQRDAAFRMQYNPAVQTANEFAKGPIAQDMMLANAANRAGNADMIRMANTKLATDMGTMHIGSMSGIRTYQEPDGSWTTINPSTGLRVNDRTGASYMPGALQAFGQRENVEAAGRTSGELTTETKPAGSGGSGGSSPVQPSATPTQGTARAKTAAPAASPATLQGHAAMLDQNYIPPVLAAAGNIPQSPGSTSLVALKAAQEHQAADASKTVDELTEKANAGQTLLAQTAQINAAASEYPWTGKFAADRGSFLSVLQGLGWATPAQIKELGAYQDATKISIMLQSIATQQLGSREAAQVFKTMGKSIPNLDMSPDGLARVSAYVNGSARYNMAMAQFAQRMLNQGNAVGAASIENSFIANTNPTYYILAAADAQTRSEFLATMPQAKRTAFLGAWDKAIKAGVAPKPNDYADLGQ